MPGAAITGLAMHGGWRSHQRTRSSNARSVGGAVDPNADPLTHCQRGAETEFVVSMACRACAQWKTSALLLLRPMPSSGAWFLRMRRGERNILHPEFIEYYGCSSGTSDTAAKNKYLPVSREQIRWQQKAGF